MRITIEIQDSRVSSFMEILRSLSYVKVVAGEEGNLLEEPTMTHYASEKVLDKDWLTPEEDEAWKDL
jgi:hypothetical protein